MCCSELQLIEMRVLKKSWCGDNILQHAAAYCNILQLATRDGGVTDSVGDNMLQHAAPCCNMLQHAATCCNMLQHAATCCIAQQHTAIYCYTHYITLGEHPHLYKQSMGRMTLLQHTATCCNILAYCNTLQHTLYYQRRASASV